jgi:hypothetical protein
VYYSFLRDTSHSSVQIFEPTVVSSPSNTTCWNHVCCYDTLVFIFVKLIIIMADLPQYPVRIVCWVSRQIFIMLSTWQLFSNAHSANVLPANVHYFLTFHHFFTDPLLSHLCRRAFVLTKSDALGNSTEHLYMHSLYLYFTVLIMKMFSAFRPF